MSTVQLIKIQPADLPHLWQIGFSQKAPAWTRFNAPYFNDYSAFESAEAFVGSSVAEFLLADWVRGIEVDGQLIGMVSYYWENEATQWLNIGIIIYDETYWSQGIGTRAMQQWLDIIFDLYPELEHIGLVTWSGKPGMMHSATKLGMQQEARIRKVRYYQGVYYDSLMYGILRDEWEKLK